MLIPMAFFNLDSFNNCMDKVNSGSNCQKCIFKSIQTEYSQVRFDKDKYTYCCGSYCDINACQNCVLYSLNYTTICPPTTTPSPYTPVIPTCSPCPELSPTPIPCMPIEYTCPTCPSCPYTPGLTCPPYHTYPPYDYMPWSSLGWVVPIIIVGGIIILILCLCLIITCGYVMYNSFPLNWCKHVLWCRKHQVVSEENNVLIERQTPPPYSPSRQVMLMTKIYKNKLKNT